MLALKLIQIKGSTSVKAMFAQLQTTFIKAIGDPQSELIVRRSVIENIELLINIAPKVDPIVKELTALIDSDKINGEQKIEVSEALALVIRVKGKVITQAKQTEVFTVLNKIISEDRSSYNDAIIVNSCMCIAFLSAYASDTKQMQTLYTTYDETEEPLLMLPIKLGILINGNAKLPEPQKLIEILQAYIVERIVETAGIEEVDEDCLPLGDESEMFRFNGNLEILGHLVNRFVRKFCTPEAPIVKAIYESLNKSGLYQKINEQEEICKDSFSRASSFLA